MKYEMIFGDEGLFDGAPEECILAVRMPGGDPVFYLEKNKSELRGNVAILKYGFIKLAMRRIIKEPKRWTVEDQKAGRLPEVGSIFTYRDETLTCHFIDGDGEIWAHDIDNKIVTPLLRDCKPIETPREKYDRERDEWVNSLRNKLPPLNMSFINGMIKAYEELKPFTGDDHD